jgi:GxxExxY protein
MAIALAEQGLEIQTEAPLHVWFRGRQIARFSVDLVVQGVVLVEVKAFHELEARHKAQMLNYLRASDFEVGLILNFTHKAEFERLVFGNSRKSRPLPSSSP